MKQDTVEDFLFFNVEKNLIDFAFHFVLLMMLFTSQFLTLSCTEEFE